MPVKELERIKNEHVIHLKGVLQSTDGGKTWVVVKQDAVVNTSGQPLSVNLQGLVLKRAKRNKRYSVDKYDPLKDLAEHSDATDTEAMTQLLSHWYDSQE
ncbi:MAG TPA: hypothetical protein ENN68_05125 [Methanomicrobia archaeon]|nr:hypothetical protein [Methanomicrobia archaeon]